MSAGRMYTTNQRTILERIQEMNDFLRSFMTNQATPHLGALSSLINSETSNHRRQLRIDTAFIVEWMANWTSQHFERAKKALNSKQMHPINIYIFLVWIFFEWNPIFYWFFGIENVNFLSFWVLSSYSCLCFSLHRDFLPQPLPPSVFPPLYPPTQIFIRGRSTTTTVAIISLYRFLLLFSFSCRSHRLHHAALHAGQTTTIAGQPFSPFFFFFFLVVLCVNSRREL